MRAASKTGLRKSPGAARKPKLPAGTEIEIKLRVADRRALVRQLARLRAELICPRVHEMNTLYDTAEGDLMRQGRMLRVRVERPASRLKSSAKRQPGRARGNSGLSAVLTFKGPVGPLRQGTKRAAKAKGKPEKPPAYKIREEHEIRLADAGEVTRIIEALGFRPSFRYEKFRTTYGLSGVTHLKIELDETPIGLFLELEGPAREIDRAATRLGFGRADYITKSYGALFLEERRAGRSLASCKRAGAAGKFRPEPIEGRGEQPTEARPGVAVPRDEPTRLSGPRDMLFRSSR